LSAADRDAVLLRFLEQRTLAEVGTALGSNEDAARKRVSRALEKLRAALARRGVKTAVIPLSAALTLNSIQAAPAGLAAALATESLGAAAGAGTTLTLLKLMTTTKIKAGLLGTVAAAGVTASVLVHQANAARLHDADEQNRDRSEEIAQLGRDNERLAGLAAVNEPSSNGSLDELQRLRAEADRLRSQAGELPQLREANAALKRRAAGAAPSKTALQLKEETMATMDASKKWLVAFILYAGDNQDQFPPSLEAATPAYLRKTKEEIDADNKQFELIYRGSLTAITNPMNTIVLREREAWQTPEGRWSRVYGFADGHVEVHSEAANDFEAWEQSRLIPPPDDRKP
jgi:hypothetical protein